MVSAGMVLAQQQGINPGQSYGQGWHGRGMGPGMMHGQWGRGQYGPNAGPQQMQPLDKSAARNLAQNYAAGNPNLKIGQVTEQDGTYEATIVTPDGSLVERLLIDKQSGWMKRAL